MSEIRTLTRNGDVFFPLTHSDAVIGMNEFKETILNQVENYRPIEITGNVTNAPDEEDLTSVNNLLKFKDRNNLYGLGKVILRRGSSFSSQVTLSNTIYVVQYGFDLNNGHVVLPSGTILLFEGGSISNGTLVGSGTRLVYYQDLGDILTDITLEGTFIHKACDKDTVGSISVDNSSIEFNSLDQISVRNNGIQNTHLNGSVVDQSGIVLDTNNKISIKDNGVTNFKIDSSVVNIDDLVLDTNHKIKFADRTYNSQNPDGLGRVILRNNIVNGVNTLTQSMISTVNTIYEIRYDYVLGEDITIPANCILEFSGGSISGSYTLTLQNTFLNGKIACHSSIDGSIANKELHTNWFYTSGDDIFETISTLLADNRKIIIDNGTYTVEKTLLLSNINNVILDFNGSTIVDNLPESEADANNRIRTFFVRDSASDIVIRNINYRKSENKFIDSEYSIFPFSIGITGVSYPGAVKNVTIENVDAECDYAGTDIVMFMCVTGDSENIVIRNINYDGLIPYFFNSEYGLSPLEQPNGKHPYNITVENIHCKNCTNSISILRISSSYNVIFNNVYGENVGTFIECYSGDDSILRAQETAIFNNCVSTTSQNLVTGVLIDNNVKSTTDTGLQFDSSYIFNNCEFKETATSGIDYASAVAIRDLYSNVEFNGCKFSGFRRGLYLKFINDKINPNIKSKYKNINFNKCIFRDNGFDSIENYTQLIVKDCQFVNSGTITFYNNDNNVAENPYFEFINCLFSRDTTSNSLFIDARSRYSASKYSIIKNCTFVGNSSYAVNNAIPIIIDNCIGNKIFYADGSHYLQNYHDNASKVCINLTSSDTIINANSCRYFVVGNGVVASINSLYYTGSQYNMDIEITVIGTGRLTIIPNSAQSGYYPIYSPNNDIVVVYNSIVKIKPVLANNALQAVFEVIPLKISDSRWVLMSSTDRSQDPNKVDGIDTNTLNYVIGNDTTVYLGGVNIPPGTINKHVEIIVVGTGSLTIVPNNPPSGWSPIYSPQNNPIVVTNSIVRIKLVEANRSAFGALEITPLS